MNKNAEHWIDKRIGEARTYQQPTITEAVAIRMTKLLEGKLSKAPLAKKEMSETAKALIADMATPDAPEVQFSRSGARPTRSHSTRSRSRWLCMARMQPASRALLTLSST